LCCCSMEWYWYIASHLLWKIQSDLYNFSFRSSLTFWNMPHLERSWPFFVPHRADITMCALPCHASILASFESDRPSHIVPRERTNTLNCRQLTVLPCQNSVNQSYIRSSFVSPLPRLLPHCLSFITTLLPSHHYLPGTTVVR